MDWGSINWIDVCGGANIALFLAVVAGLIYTGKQLSAMKATNALHLMIRIDERLCSPGIQKLTLEMKNWDYQNLKDEQKRQLHDMLGIFELIGLAVAKKYITLHDAEIMFGSSALLICEDYKAKNYIETAPLFLNYTKKFVKEVKDIREKRTRNAEKLVRAK